MASFGSDVGGERNGRKRWARAEAARIAVGVVASWRHGADCAAFPSFGGDGMLLTLSLAHAAGSGGGCRCGRAPWRDGRQA